MAVYNQSRSLILKNKIHLVFKSLTSVYENRRKYCARKTFSKLKETQ